MPRRKSQPAKYYHCMNELQTEEGIVSGKDGRLPDATAGVQESSDNSENRDSQSASESSPTSEDSQNFLETCRSRESEDKNIFSLNPTPKRRRMVSPKKENSLKMNPSSDGSKNEAILGAYDFTPKNGDQLGEEKKPGEGKKPGPSQLYEDNTSDDIGQTNKSPNTEEASAQNARTVLDHVYLLVTYIVQRSRMLEAAIQNEEFRNQYLNNALSNDQKSKLEALERSASPDSPQDTGNSCQNYMKLSEEEIEDLKVKAEVGKRSGTGLKRNGSISSELEQCGVCFKILRRSSMREHMDRHNDSGRYRCTVCCKTFSKLSSLEKHELIHTDARPFECDRCDKAYRQKVHLVEHKRMHTGVRPFQCSFCNYSFGSKSLLNRHVKTHGKNKTPEKESGTLNLRLDMQKVTTSNKEDTPYKTMPEKRCIEPLKQKLKSRIANNHFDCGICHSQFASEKLLSSHIEKEHQLDTSFKCSKCSSIFSSAGDLTAHMNDAHKSAQAYPCRDCTKVFAHNSSLMKHRAKEHGHRSSSLVQVMPSTRKSAHENIGVGGNKFRSEKNGSNFDTTVSDDKSSPVPTKVPRLSLLNGSEGKLDSAVVEKIAITKFMTPKCEISGSDM